MTESCPTARTGMRDVIVKPTVNALREWCGDGQFLAMETRKFSYNLHIYRSAIYAIYVLMCIAATGHKDGLVWIVRACDNLIEGRVWLRCEWYELSDQRDEDGNLVFIGQGTEEWHPAVAILCKVSLSLYTYNCRIPMHVLIAGQHV